MKRQEVVQLFCVCVIAVLVSCVSAKRYTKIGTARIVNGEIITIDKAPYVVQLRDPRGYTYCAGTLITPQHVITAAHCFPDRNPKSVTVVAGASTRSDAGLPRSIAKLAIHPGFDKPVKMDNDVAVLKLDKPLPLGKYIQPIEYLCSDPVDTNSLFQISGWGRTSENGPNSEKLHTVRLPAISQDECKAKVGATETMMCADGGSGGACQSDAGGPGIYRGELCAIVSWGIGCGSTDAPSVFTNVMAVRDFIVDNLKA